MSDSEPLTPILNKLHAKFTPSTVTEKSGGYHNASPLPPHVVEKTEAMRRIFGRRPDAPPIHDFADYQRDKEETPLEMHDQLDVTIQNPKPVTKSTVAQMQKAREEETKTEKGTKDIRLTIGEWFHKIVQHSFTGRDEFGVANITDHPLMAALRESNPEAAESIIDIATALQDFTGHDLAPPPDRDVVREMETTYRISMQQQKELIQDPVKAELALRAPNYRFIIDKLQDQPSISYAYDASARSDLVEFDCDPNDEAAKKNLLQLQEIFSHEKIFFNTRPLKDIERYQPQEKEAMQQLTQMLISGKIHATLFEIKSRLTIKKGELPDPKQVTAADYRDVAYTSNAFYQWLTLFKPEATSVEQFQEHIKKNIDLNLIGINVPIFNSETQALEKPEEFSFANKPLDQNEIDQRIKNISREVVAAEAP